MKKVLLSFSRCAWCSLCAPAALPHLPPPAAPATSAAAGTDTNTVAVGVVIIARDDVPTDEIYTFVKTIFDNASTIAGQHAKGKGWI